jgi:hypothetical protein
MSLALRYITVDDCQMMTERIAGICRQLGISETDLDRCVDSALMPLLVQVEAHREAEATRRAKIKLVSEN